MKNTLMLMSETIQTMTTLDEVLTFHMRLNKHTHKNWKEKHD